MRQEIKNRSVWLAGSSLLAMVMLVGCESKGPAEQAGEKIDTGIQKAKDTISPPGPAAKAGRGLDKATQP